MKVTVLVPNLSGNCLGRGYLLAGVLGRDYEVEICGVMKGTRVWPPFDDGRFDYLKINEKEPLDEAVEKLTGDVIYASKLLPASFGLALSKKARDGTPVVLDIDDWELAYVIPARMSPSFFAEKIKSFLGPGNAFRPTYLQEILFERRAREADAITVASTFLQKRFGGLLVPHGRDTAAFDPGKFDRNGRRAAFGLTDKRVVMFLGTPRPHKGVGFLLDAVKLCRTENVKLVIAGMNPDARYEDLVFQNRLRKAGGDRVVFLDMFSFRELPDYLMMADLVALPQGLGGKLSIRDRVFAKAQVPAKVFDAMALERPVIAAPLSDLPSILKGCGYITTASDPENFAREIDRVFLDYDRAEVLGRKAREKCIKEYSWDKMQALLRGIFSRFGGCGARKPTARNSFASVSRPGPEAIMEKPNSG